MMKNALAVLISSLVSGISTWAIFKLITLRLRVDLKTDAKAELERIRSQEGYNSASFLRRHREMSDEDAEKRELMSTAFGVELKEINSCIRKASFMVAIVVAIITTILCFIND